MGRLYVVSADGKAALWAVGQRIARLKLEMALWRSEERDAVGPQDAMAVGIAGRMIERFDRELSRLVRECEVFDIGDFESKELFDE